MREVIRLVGVFLGNVFNMKVVDIDEIYNLRVEHFLQMNVQAVFPKGA